MVKELYGLMPMVYGRYDEADMLPVVREKGIKYIIYGAGQGGRFLMDWMKRIYKIVPDFIVDRRPVANSIEGVPVISCEEFKGLKLKDKLFVMISVIAYCKNQGIRDEIDEVLQEVGKETEYIAYPAYNILAPYDLHWYYYIHEHAESFECTYDQLADNMSRETMVYYLRTVILAEKYSGVTFPEKYKYWGRDSDAKVLFVLSEQEVLLNVGAARGDTVYQYIACHNPFKKIIAVEASKQEYESLKKNLGLLGNDTLFKIQADNYFLGREGKTIDGLYIDEDISLINMDIEGAELLVLRTAVKTIKKNRPVLAICVYHKVEDLVEIPAWIKKNVNDYVFILRKYPCAWCVGRVQMLDIPELVLYAIPKERYIQ